MYHGNYSFKEHLIYQLKGTNMKNMPEAIGGNGKQRPQREEKQPTPKKKK